MILGMAMGVSPCLICFLPSERQLGRIAPHFLLSHGIPRVDARRRDQRDHLRDPGRLAMEECAPCIPKLRVWVAASKLKMVRLPAIQHTREFWDRGLNSF